MDDTSFYQTTHTTISVNIKVPSNSSESVNLLNVFLWLVEQDWCDTILEQMWGSTSLGRDGVFSYLKERSRGGNTWMTVEVTSLNEVSLQNPGTLSVYIDVGQMGCVPDDVFMITLIKRWKETSQCTPQLASTVVKEILKVESSKQIHSLACCSMTVDSKSQIQHLVAPAIST